MTQYIKLNDVENILALEDSIDDLSFCILKDKLYSLTSINPETLIEKTIKYVQSKS